MARRRPASTTPPQAVAPQSMTRKVRLYEAWPGTLGSSGKVVHGAPKVQAVGATRLHRLEVGAAVGPTPRQSRPPAGAGGASVHTAFRTCSSPCSARKVAVESWLPSCTP